MYFGIVGLSNSSYILRLSFSQYQCYDEILRQGLYSTYSEIPHVSIHQGMHVNKKYLFTKTAKQIVNYGSILNNRNQD